MFCSGEGFGREPARLGQPDLLAIFFQVLQQSDAGRHLHRADVNLRELRRSPLTGSLFQEWRRPASWQNRRSEDRGRTPAGTARRSTVGLGTHDRGGFARHQKRLPEPRQRRRRSRHDARRLWFWMAKATHANTSASSVRPTAHKYLRGNHAQSGCQGFLLRLVGPDQLVAAQRHGQAQRELLAGGFMEFLELGPEPRDVDPHGRVRLRIEIRTASERFGRNRVLAELLALVLPQ